MLTASSRSLPMQTYRQSLIVSLKITSARVWTVTGIRSTGTRAWAWEDGGLAGDVCASVQFLLIVDLTETET